MVLFFLYSQLLCSYFLFDFFSSQTDSSVGAGIDSYYEYCLKAYILLGDDRYLERFNRVCETHLNSSLPTDNKSLGQWKVLKE